MLRRAYYRTSSNSVLCARCSLRGVFVEAVKDPCKLASLGLIMDAYVMISLGQHCGSPTAQLDLYNKTSKLPLQLHRSRLSSPYLTISDWDFAEGLLKLDFHMYFKGNLWTNRAEGIGGCLQAVDFPTIMGEMVDSKF